MRPLLAAILLVAACGGSSKKVEAPPPVDPLPKKEPEPPPPPPPPQPTVTLKEIGLATPESVLYDAADDFYFVSNINGGPSAADGNGFISRIAPDGTIDNLKFIDGSKKGSTLNAPKGMAIVGDVLYVADLDTLRLFDRKTGAPKGAVKLKGATFANDVVAAADGSIWVTDSGIKIDENGVTDTGTDGIWVVDKKKKAKQVAKGQELGRPNGISVDASSGTVWVCTFGSGELYSIDAKGVKDKVQKLPGGQCDGLFVNGDQVWATSWEKSAVYKGTIGGELTEVWKDLKSPADFGFDQKRNIVLIPQFLEDRVVGFEVKE
jgi:sugar lactone lactonase YvrE